ncbi:hypothetical protein [Bacillus sp. JCM 19034]|uniref:hypothetical protein n=1 Tax=Bacillus sp. JCM 19034 TaxID=1481928 RepID=UPI000B23A95B|nr:hypothetical protein [Bacillus sp. JCM 19034]
MEIIELLNTPSVITGKESIVGIDHLDSFLRDTYLAGEIEYIPKNILSKMSCTSRGIDTDQATGLYLLKLIQKDHELFYPRLW